MKLTESRLRSIIREELSQLTEEMGQNPHMLFKKAAEMVLRDERPGAKVEIDGNYVFINLPNTDVLIEVDFDQRRGNIYAYIGSEATKNEDKVKLTPRVTERGSEAYNKFFNALFQQVRKAEEGYTTEGPYSNPSGYDARY